MVIKAIEHSTMDQDVSAYSVSKFLTSFVFYIKCLEMVTEVAIIIFYSLQGRCDDVLDFIFILLFPHVKCFISSITLLGKGVLSSRHGCNPTSDKSWLKWDIIWTLVAVMLLLASGSLVVSMHSDCLEGPLSQAALWLTFVSSVVYAIGGGYTYVIYAKKPELRFTENRGIACRTREKGWGEAGIEAPSPG